MRVAITGAAGFVGGHLARRLLADGHQVTAAVLAAEQIDELVAAGARRVDFDLLEINSFDAVCADQDVVFSVAGWVNRKDPELAERLNNDATQGMVQAASRAGVRRLLVVSSVAVYGEPKSDRVTEEHPMDPDQSDPYGRSKALGEEAARKAAEGTELELVIVRPGMIYGPGSARWTVQMAALIGKGAPVLVGPGDGHAFPVYIDNLVDLMVLAATHPNAAGEAFHASDTSVPWHSWFSFFGQMLGRPVRRIPAGPAYALIGAGEMLGVKVPLTRWHLRMYARKLDFTADKARRLLGWESAVDLEEGMRRSEAWLRQTGRIQ